MVIGAVCAVLHGSAQPLMLLVFGLLTDTFVEYDIELNELSDDRKECVNNTIQWKKNYTEGLDSTQLGWDSMTNSTWEMLVPLRNRSCGYVARDVKAQIGVFVVLVSDLWSVSVLPFRILDIEYEMTKFAFYYVGIAAAVFVLGYFQVGYRTSTIRPSPSPAEVQSAWHSSPNTNRPSLTV